MDEQSSKSAPCLSGHAQSTSTTQAQGHSCQVEERAASSSPQRQSWTMARFLSSKDEPFNARTAAGVVPWQHATGGKQAKRTLSLDAMNGSADSTGGGELEQPRREEEHRDEGKISQSPEGKQKQKMKRSDPQE